MRMTSQKYKLNTGAEIPAVGLGTWQSKPGELEKVFANPLPFDSCKAVVYAIDEIGYLSSHWWVFFFWK